MIYKLLNVKSDKNIPQETTSVFRVYKITKIVAGMDKETTEILAELYGLIANVYKAQAKDIKTAEAANVIDKPFLRKKAFSERKALPKEQFLS